MFRPVISTTKNQRKVIWVTLDDWREVVTGALQAAKNGDAQARTCLAQYLVGKPESKAPTPLAVIVNQLQGSNPVANKLADNVTPPLFDFGLDTSNPVEITRRLQAELEAMGSAMASSGHADSFRAV